MLGGAIFPISRPFVCLVLVVMVLVQVNRKELFSFSLRRVVVYGGPGCGTAPGIWYDMVTNTVQVRWAFYSSVY